MLIETQWLTVDGHIGLTLLMYIRREKKLSSKPLEREAYGVVKWEVDVLMVDNADGDAASPAWVQQNPDSVL